MSKTSHCESRPVNFWHWCSDNLLSFFMVQPSIANEKYFDRAVTVIVIYMYLTLLTGSYRIS